MIPVPDSSAGKISTKAYSWQHNAWRHHRSTFPGRREGFGIATFLAADHLVPDADIRQAPRIITCSDCHAARQRN